MAHKTIIQVEVLTDEPYSPDSLEQVYHDITHGDASGHWEVKDSKELGPQATADALVAQGSTPYFLLSEDHPTWNIVHVSTGESFTEEWFEEQAAYEWLSTMIAEGKIDGKMEDYAVEKCEDTHYG